jgi:hypothetical protein
VLAVVALPLLAAFFPRTRTAARHPRHSNAELRSVMFSPVLCWMLRLLPCRWRRRGCRRRRVAVENVGHHFPLSVRLFLPHFHVLALFRHRGRVEGLFRAHRVGAGHVAQVAGSCDFYFIGLPGQRNAWSYHRGPRAADGLLAVDDRGIRRQQRSVVTVVRNRCVQVIWSRRSWTIERPNLEERSRPRRAYPVAASGRRQRPAEVK